MITQNIHKCFVYKFERLFSLIPYLLVKYCGTPLKHGLRLSTIKILLKHNNILSKRNSDTV